MAESKAVTKKVDVGALTRAATLLLERQVMQRPVHIHMCPEGHVWPCPSAYCEDVARRPRRCPGCGGELPRDTTVDDFTAGEEL